MQQDAPAWARRGKVKMGSIVTFEHKGDWSKTEKWLIRTNNNDLTAVLKTYGDLGVKALQESTPIRTGQAALSWYYDITQETSGVSIDWKNSNVNDNVCVAVLLQYGHGTKNGAYVQGIDYINPALKPVFDTIADKLWEEVTKV